MYGEDVILTENDKREKVTNKKLYAVTDFSLFKKGEAYFIEYLNDDTYRGLSDNILNETIKITPFELYYYFSYKPSTAFETCLSLWFKTIINSKPLNSENIENFCDRNARQAKRMLMGYLTENDKN